MHLGILGGIDLFPPQGDGMVTTGQALESVQRVCELEREVAVLRATLAAMPPSTAQNQQWKDELARLLGEVVLFRLALAREPVLSSIKSK
ncbi:MAG TPA: hypothetical protein VF616_07560 [Duganella sp.]|uniref:hypothetical protein n=1 Tax=Duganella sp. TaxID=1904440 RepID=UPI002ED6B7E1